MSKINFTLDITDEMIDNAANQLLQNKIRQAVNAKFDAQINQLVDQIVEQKTRGIVDSLKTRWSWGSQTEKELQAKIIEKMAEAHVSEDTIRAYVKKTLEPVMKYASEKMQYLDDYVNRRASQIDEEYIAHVVAKASDFMKTAFGTLFYDSMMGNRETKQEEKQDV